MILHNVFRDIRNNIGKARTRTRTQNSVDGVVDETNEDRPFPSLLLNAINGLSEIVRNPVVPKPVQCPIEKIIQYGAIGRWIARITPNPTIGEALQLVDPRVNNKDTELLSMLYNDLHQTKSTDRIKPKYSQFFGPGKALSLPPDITDRDIVESLYLRRPTAPSCPPCPPRPPRSSDTSVFFGWFANYFTHLFLWTAPEDPTRQEIGGFSSTAIYGTTDQDSQDLRTGQGGKVHLENAFAPTLDYLDRANGRTPLKTRKNLFAGRNNTHVGLPVVHTLFLLEHNRVCDVLCAVYPHYTDERVFQIARDAVMNTLFHLVRTEYVSTFAIAGPLTSAATMGPNLLSRRLHQLVPSGQSLLSVEYLLVYAWHGATDETISIPGNPREIGTEEWFRDPLGALDTTFPTHRQAFEDLMAYACTTPIAGGLNRIRDVPRFLSRAEEGLLGIQRSNGVSCYNEARRQLGLRPYTDFEDLVAGTVLQVSEMERLFGSIENVDFYTGIKIDNSKTAEQYLMCSAAMTIIGSLAFGKVPAIHGALQSSIPPCLLAEVDTCKKNGFLTTLLQHHVPAFRNVPIQRRFHVIPRCDSAV
jgi:hypothetical protein